MPALRFVLRPETFCVHRLPPGSALDMARLAAAPWYSVTRTPDEVSVVAPESIDLGAAATEPGWSCLQIAAILDFSLVGVLAGVSRVLADAHVAIFVVSTYDTDYILLKQRDVETAVRALTAAGHTVSGG